ncbi:MAG: restriction endonuclease subunit S [Deltaproteobacteria bacterium]|nr:restriction endonuclease subunit S [Deltaproteobacteria bacterium]
MASELPHGWRTAKLNDLGEVNRGKSKHRPRWAEHLYGGAYPFIQTGDVKASEGRITSFSQTYSGAGLRQSRLWPKGTMCITIAANIAETGVLTFDACFPDSVVGFVADEKKANVYFVEYVFRYIRHRIQREATGSVQDNINLKTLARLDLPLPPLDEQRRIAAVLGSLDDKIELNRKMNRTLEEMAQAIFKSWFIDFDGMPDSEMVESELGPIPRGWEVKPVSEIVTLIGGGTPKKSVAEYWGGDIPWFSVRDAPAPGDVFVLDTEAHITEAGLAGSSARLVEPWTTIISARGTVGKLAVAAGRMTFNQSCYGVRASSAHGDVFIHFVLRDIVEHLRRSAHGSVFDTITRKTFETAMVRVPPADRAVEFDRTVEPLLQRILSNGRESRTLANLRDALLPKLISGEIRVPEAEEAVEVAS